MEAIKTQAPVGRADGRGMQVDASKRAKWAVSRWSLSSPPPQMSDGQCLRWGGGGCLVGGSCMNLCTWGLRTAVSGACSGESAFALRGRERKERSGICRQGLNGSRPRGMRWAESTIEPADSLSWAGPNGQRKPPLARCWASPPLQKRRRDAAYGTVLFVPGRLLNSYHTFHMCTSASHCLLLSAPPRLSGCAFITSAVSTRPPLFSSFLPAGPTKPFRPGQLSRTRADWHRGGGDRPRSGRGDAAER